MKIKVLLDKNLKNQFASRFMKQPILTKDFIGITAPHLIRCWYSSNSCEADYIAEIHRHWCEELSWHLKINIRQNKIKMRLDPKAFHSPFFHWVIPADIFRQRFRSKPRPETAFLYTLNNSNHADNLPSYSYQIEIIFFCFMLSLHDTLSMNPIPTQNAFEKYDIIYWLALKIIIIIL